MRYKDIPDRPILEFLNENPDRGHTWFPGKDNDVHQAMPDGVQDKLLLAKMRKLIKRGLVDGCACGCRGDFVITKKGKETLR
ncbi:MAG: hypothetical protein KAS32_30960 [Candidatus Peribacteraceae bacterium]|nr:hypothetical protein [Candidatus Peribacteraceae bacterium]